MQSLAAITPYDALRLFFFLPLLASVVVVVAVIFDSGSYLRKIIVALVGGLAGYWLFYPPINWPAFYMVSIAMQLGLCGWWFLRLRN